MSDNLEQGSQKSESESTIQNNNDESNQGNEEKVVKNNDDNLSTHASPKKPLSIENSNMGALLKVPVSLSIEVGRTKMPLGDLLETQEGTVIELERLLDEPLDVLVNGALIAHGVIVLANEQFGLQITDIISKVDRAKSL
ncbi:MAG: flagellar motor switch protein FliN [SAR86 cluster bacterium]|uniref:Flagellar motor switch protein FliN n=1 Tax=SAR86 cluster bacterium TaxID=2030880 RepID=A0A2A5CAI6_9GAMM|nr:MAG: flagellar motor switch protein FliN [SAR86 cluster bacterium]